MIVQYIRYHIAPEQQAEFVAAYEEASAHFRESEHCLAYELSQCTDEAAQFVLRIEWDSMEGHLQGFRPSEGFQRYLAQIQPFTLKTQEMRYYRPTSVQWRAS